MRKRTSVIKILGFAAQVSMAERLAYRGDFFLNLLMSVLFEMVTPLVTVLIYRSGSSFPGWTVGEALLIQAIFLMARGIAFPCFFGIVFTVFDQVRDGSWELTLLKPRSPLLIALARSLDVQGFGRLAAGVALFVYSLGQIAQIGLFQVLLFAALFALSLLVLFSFALIMAGSLFVWVGNGRVYEVMDSILVFSQYPGSIFSQGFQFVLSVLIPASMVAFLPAQALLGRPDPITIVSVPACFAFFGASLLFWREMMKRYTGGGG
jgi:ABC-2 type transport system permease protein